MLAKKSLKFNSALHPRYPKGHPNAGKFMSKGGADYKKAVVKAIAKNIASGKLKQLSTKSNTSSNLKKIVVKAKGSFPADINSLQDVKALGGSTGAKLVRDPKTGKQYVLKIGKSSEHIKEESQADNLYKAMGANVPNHRLYNQNGKTYKLAEHIEGKPLSSLTGSELGKVHKQLQKHFVADALMANWDVIGMDADNIIVDKKGKVYRIDNGGSLRYRAQGSPKGAAFGDHPMEMYSMRDTASVDQYSAKSQAAKVFGALTHDEIMSQVRSISSKRKLIESRIKDPELKKQVGNRIDELERLGKFDKTLKDDQFKESYRSDFIRHSLGLRADGVIDRITDKLTLSSVGSTEYTDNKGKPFDNLRGGDSAVNRLSDYMGKNGGDYNLISGWAHSQGGSSWSGSSRAMKAHLADQIDIGADNFYWHKGSGESKNGLTEAKDSLVYLYGSRSSDKYKTFTESVSAFHAFNHELLQKIEFEGKQSNGTVRLYRTEASEVIKDLNKMKEGDTKVINRGLLESTSLISPVSVYGNELTVQDVPLHRIIGTYFQSRYAKNDAPMFLGDHENEFGAMMYGIPTTYLGARDGDGIIKIKNNSFDEYEPIYKDFLGGKLDPVNSTFASKKNSSVNPSKSVSNKSKSTSPSASKSTRKKTTSPSPSAAQKKTLTDKVAAIAKSTGQEPKQVLIDMVKNHLKANTVQKSGISDSLKEYSGIQVGEAIATKAGTLKKKPDLKKLEELAAYLRNFRKSSG